MIRATVLFIIDPDRHRVVLGDKLAKIGKGSVLAPGGKYLTRREPHKKCAIRETHEETGLKASNLRYHGTLVFRNAKPAYSFRVRMYTALKADCTGRLKGTPKFRPFWYDIKRLPTSRMMSGDPIWIPWVLAGRRVSGTVWRDSQLHLMRHTLRSFKKP